MPCKKRLCADIPPSADAHAVLVTSSNMPDNFAWFQWASGIVERAMDGQSHSTIDLDLARIRLREVYTAQCQAWQSDVDNSTLLSEIAITLYKSAKVAALTYKFDDLRENQESLWDTIGAHAAGRKLVYRNFIGPCEWFSQQALREERERSQRQPRDRLRDAENAQQA
jgi:hypothetical protein